MRIILILVLLTHITTGVLAQDDVDEKKMVGFGCYFAGQPTKPVIKVTEMLKGKKYGSISDLLKTGSEAEKYLAVVSLEKLSNVGQYELSEAEKKLIAKIKTSPERVQVCSGCTYFDKVSLKKMFSEENFLGSAWWIEEILEETQKP